MAEYKYVFTHRMCEVLYVCVCVAAECKYVFTHRMCEVLYVCVCVARGSIVYGS